jgi:hypothetical protein
MHDCNQPLHPRAADGIRLFNLGRYFEAHEALEQAWNEEPGEVRDLYRGILQAAVVYLHISRGNLRGAEKVHERCRKWLSRWPAECRGVQVGQLRDDLGRIIAELGVHAQTEAEQFDRRLLRPVVWHEQHVRRQQMYLCDRCGREMHEEHCKITCPNCGNRFDCSDLTLNMD